MSANVPAETADRGAAPDDDEALWAELKELAKQFPEPDWREAARGWAWFYDGGQVDAPERWSGKTVAIHDGRVVGVAGPEEHYLSLYIRLVREYQKHPAWFYATHLDDPFGPI
jgi:hypothetical protein